MSSLVYMTAGSREAALELARDLVGRKLCAGINILPSALSVYWWQGKIHEKEECLLIAQVGDEVLSDFINSVEAAHSYDVPCVVALPIVAGLAPFLDWIEKNGQGGEFCA